MRALDPEVVDAIWAAIEPVVPVPDDTHPLGCHRPRASDRACFQVMLVRLVTGCSWEGAERLCGNVVSDTTVRGRRDAWTRSGVFRRPSLTELPEAQSMYVTSLWCRRDDRWINVFSQDTPATPPISA